MRSWFQDNCSCLYNLYVAWLQPKYKLASEYSVAPDPYSLRRSDGSGLSHYSELSHDSLSSIASSDEDLYLVSQTKNQNREKTPEDQMIQVQSSPPALLRRAAKKSSKCFSSSSSLTSFPSFLYESGERLSPIVSTAANSRSLYNVSPAACV
ncbi:MAG: hypothetical protein VX112_00590 [Pseudomonadota bacterium]|nr:hypothetical protein [Pseudomonadota bacterium]